MGIKQDRCAASKDSAGSLISIVSWIGFVFMFFGIIFEASGQSNEQNEFTPACGLGTDKHTCHSQPRYSLHSCVGETSKLRSCHFRDLYLRLVDRKWIYFQNPDDPPRVKIAGQRFTSTDFSAASSQDEDTYFVNGDFIQWGKGGDSHSDVSFTPLVILGPPPLPAKEHTSQEVTVLWEFSRNSAYSYGHCLLNDWFPMFLTMHTHLEQMPHHFNIISHNPIKLSDLSPAVHTCIHYTSAWSKAPVHDLQFLLTATEVAGLEYAHLSEVIVGESGFSEFAANLVYPESPMPRTISMFNTINWRNFRKTMYSAFQIKPLSSTAINQQEMSIVIVARPKEEFRK